MIGRFLKIIASILFLAVAAFLGRESKSSSASGSSEPPKQKTGWKCWALRGAILISLLGLGGFLLSASGIIPIKSSSRHWAITRWFLNFSKERSVATHSLGIKPPPLDVEWRVLKGAGHFETGCRPCHGAPDISQPRIAFRMTPPPPPLGKEVAEWDPAELFYIVKHGIKFTGMPAWPAEHRDDEIWAVVAFLQKLPSLDGESYRRLVEGEPQAVTGAPIEHVLPSESIRPLIRQNCSRCHGHDGNGRGTGAFPKLAGQKPEYLFASLAAYASGARNSGIMEPIAAALTPEMMRELADYYSRLTRNSTTHANVNLERGRLIASYGIPAKQVPACAECHLSNSGPKNQFYPFLTGQYPEYIQLQLELFQKQHRGGTAYSNIMQHVARNLTATEIRDIAAFFASLNPPGEINP